MASTNIIVAVGKSTELGFPIGVKGNLPWKCKEDMKWFKETTMGHVVIMGRNTYDSIGGPLTGRKNIIVTSKDVDYNGSEEVYVKSSIEDAINFGKTISTDDIFIIGGASIYKYVLDNDLVDNIYIDFIDEWVNDADAFFPFFFIEKEWSRITEVKLSEDATYRIYHRVNGLKNNVDNQYLDLMRDIIDNGEVKETRAGKTRSLFGKQLRFNLKDGLPMLTTKKMFSKGVIHELLWFIKGDTNIKYLIDNGVHIWDDDAYRYYIELTKEYKDGLSKIYDKDTFLKMVKLGSFSELILNRDKTRYYYGDLGPVYGAQWTNWNWHNQIEEVIDTLKKNPNDRRMIISAWNVGDIPDMALPPCHFCCQFYTKKMTEVERWNYFETHMLKEYNEEGHYNLYVSRGENYLKGSLVSYLDRMNVPSRKLSCMFQMRSNDWFLGNPFNILSYAIFTHMIAQCVNMDVDELIFNGGDCHIYENQLDACMEQLSRNPITFKLPTLKLNSEIKNISDFTYDDIKIEGYESYPTIKAPLSVGL